MRQKGLFSALILTPERPPEFAPVSAPAPEFAPVSALAPDQSREMALAPDQSLVVSPEAVLLSLVLSRETPERHPPELPALPWPLGMGPALEPSCPLVNLS